MLLEHEPSLRQVCSSLPLKSFPIGQATLKELNADLRRAINRGRIRATNQGEHRFQKAWGKMREEVNDQDNV